jgi:hypothetical protein
VLESADGWSDPIYMKLHYGVGFFLYISCFHPRHPGYQTHSSSVRFCAIELIINYHKTGFLPVDVDGIFPSQSLHWKIKTENFIEVIKNFNFRVPITTKEEKNLHA